MKLDFDNPAHVKLALLSEGLTFAPEAVAEVGTRYTERPFAYNSSDPRSKAAIRTPAELILPGDIPVSAHRRPASPWRVVCSKTEGEFQLNKDGRAICSIRYPERPAYYERKLSGGRPANHLVSQYSVSVLGIFLCRRCHYCQVGVPCKFCSIEPTRRSHRDMEDAPELPQLLEAAKLAFSLDPGIRYIDWSGGADEDPDRGFMAAIKAILSVDPYRPKRIRHHLLVMPPRDVRLLQQLSVVDEPTFALEVWDPDLFRDVCPGKHAFYGRERFLDAFAECVTRLGRGRVSCNLVAGLEPLDSLLDGCERLARMGVVPQTAAFHPDVGTAYSGKPPPSIDELLEIAVALRDIYRSRGFRPYRLGCRRASVDGEAYEGYFDA